MSSTQCFDCFEESDHYFHTSFLLACFPERNLSMEQVRPYQEALSRRLCRLSYFAMNTQILGGVLKTSFSWPWGYHSNSYDSNLKLSSSIFFSGIWVFVKKVIKGLQNHSLFFDLLL